MPLYSVPSVSFTPNIYTPLYYVVAAMVSVVTGTGSWRCARLDRRVDRLLLAHRRSRIARPTTD